MSWSLKLQNGDLQLGPTGGFNTVTGPAKMTQDLRCALLEPLGTDPLHPSYGTTLDGGSDPVTGRNITGLIGTINDPATAALVRQEVNRVVRGYQAQQIARNQTDLLIYGKSTLTADEAVVTIENIVIKQVQDQMFVTVFIQTGFGSLPLTIPFVTS